MLDELWTFISECGIGDSATCFYRTFGLAFSCKCRKREKTPITSLQHDAWLIGLKDDPFPQHKQLCSQTCQFLQLYHGTDAGNGKGKRTNGLAGTGSWNCAELLGLQRRGRGERKDEENEGMCKD